MTVLYANGDDSSAARASLILHDLTVASGRAMSMDGRVPFDWLEPGYSNDIYLPAPQRLNAGLISLPAKERRLTARGVRAALSTAATQWLGAQLTLNLLDWARVSVPELLSPRLLVALVFHHNPHDQAESAFWIREIVRRYESWQLNVFGLAEAAKSVSAEQWMSVARRSADADRVDVTCWLIGLFKGDASLVSAVRESAFVDLRRKLPALPPGIVDWWDDVEQPVAKAAGIRGAVSAEDASIKLASKAFLQDFACGAGEDWPLSEPSEQTVMV